MTRLAPPLGAGVVLSLASPPFDFYPGVWLGMIALEVVLGERSRPIVTQGMSGGAAPAAPASSAAATARAGDGEAGAAPEHGADAARAGDEERRARRERWARLFEGGARGLAFGFGANLVAFRFVPEVITRFTPLPWAVGALALVLLAAAQGLRWMVAALVRTYLVRRGLPRWASFAAGVYAGTFFPMVFPWNPAGAVSPWPSTVQLAELAGERGVTALMALTAGIAAAAIAAARRGDRRALVRRAAIAFALPIATWAWGAARIRAVDAERAAAPTIRVGLVEPSIGATERWDARQASTILSGLTSLTRDAERRGADLTVWPESAYPYVVSHGSRRAPVGRLAVLGFGVRGPIVTGMITADDAGSYNSAVVVSPDGALSTPYDKVHLLWFGETVPLADLSPWIRRTFARGIGLTPGTAQVALQAGPARVAVLNCFEDILPGAGREAMAVAPSLLVNVTNDAWFAGSAESELHLRMAAMRAVEERRDFVRAVNFGPTTWIDATGAVRGRYDPPAPGVLIATPALLARPLTPFGRFGDAPWALAIAALAAFGVRRGRAAAFAAGLAVDVVAPRGGEAP